MLYTRGAPAIYNQWASVTGYPEWAWDGVEPFFRRIEKSQGGPVQTTQHAPLFGFYKYIEKSAVALGLQSHQNINSASAPASGHFYLDYTIDCRGFRHSALRSYLPLELALRRRGRLAICTGATVTRLELDVKGCLVTGVRVKSAKEKIEAVILPRREVIVCGGAISTPQLLQLSGIGPAPLLKQQDIPLKHDLPVGVHLADHWGIPISTELPFNETFHFMEQSSMQALWQVARFLVGRGGWMRSPSTQSAIFMNTSHMDTKSFRMRLGDAELDASRHENIPDVEIMVIPANAAPGTQPGKSLATLYVCLLQTQSEGSVRIASSDPDVDPRIHTCLFTDPGDIEVARNALRFTLSLTEHFMTSSGYPYRARLAVAPRIDGEFQDVRDHELDEFARTNARAVLHLGCTCRMGKKEKGGVVDEELRVHGVANLRVADASVFPILPATHTMAPTYMVAERCAEFIKNTWKAKNDVHSW
ncbi:hypothetical protein DL769_005105 [Monosporascus sp. CRB-8-3]|nr:hypothetical protein DL769_005105 [Monosporascus sp. CRB-8-3]